MENWCHLLVGSCPDLQIELQKGKSLRYSRKKWQSADLKGWNWKNSRFKHSSLPIFRASLLFGISNSFNRLIIGGKPYKLPTDAGVAESADASDLLVWAPGWETPRVNSVEVGETAAPKVPAIPSQAWVYSHEGVETWWLRPKAWKGHGQGKVQTTNRRCGWRKP